MGIAINTAGVQFAYGIETAKGTKPTEFTLIPDIKSVPEMNPEPSALETTTLAETEFKTYIQGLKDLGGALGFGANYTEELETVWDALVEAYKTAKAEGLATWFQVIHPTLKKSVFFTGEPSTQGLPAIETDSILETTCYIVPTSAPKWDTKVAVK